MREWRQIPGYEGVYDVSNAGTVRRVGRRKIAIYYIRGYPALKLSKGGAAKTFYVHKLVSAAFLGPRPTGLAVNHLDGNKRNNAPANLEYATYAANNQHAYDVCGKGAKIRRGDRHQWSKLSADQVRQIRAMRASGKTLQVVADTFGICIQHVANIAHRKAWSHV